MVRGDSFNTRLSNRLFITGIPTGGKSYLAKKLAKEVGGIHVQFDRIRDRYWDDSHYGKWTSFYWSQDERTYYTTTSAEKQWDNLVQQSEHLWPLFIEEVERLKDEHRPVIFEGVSIMPHLAARDLSFAGICLIGDSLAMTRERLDERPRWGKTDELKDFEASSFFMIERPRYMADAKKHGYPVFETADSAYETALRFLSV